MALVLPCIKWEKLESDAQRKGDLNGLDKCIHHKWRSSEVSSTSISLKSKSAKLSVLCSWFWNSFSSCTLTQVLILFVSLLKNLATVFSVFCNTFPCNTVQKETLHHFAKSWGFQKCRDRRLNSFTSKTLCEHEAHEELRFRPSLETVDEKSRLDSFFPWLLSFDHHCLEEPTNWFLVDFSSEQNKVSEHHCRVTSTSQNKKTTLFDKCL